MGNSGSSLSHRFLTNWWRSSRRGEGAGGREPGCFPARAWTLPHLKHACWKAVTWALVASSQRAARKAWLTSTAFPPNRDRVMLSLQLRLYQHCYLCNIADLKRLSLLLVILFILFKCLAYLNASRKENKEYTTFKKKNPNLISPLHICSLASHRRPPDARFYITEFFPRTVHLSSCDIKDYTSQRDSGSLNWLPNFFYRAFWPG